MSATRQRDETRPGYPAGVVWFGMGVALTTATQLRPGGVPLGVGEILLLFWSIAVLLLVVWNDRIAVPPALRPFAAFWFFSYLFLSLGWTQALLRGLASKYDLYDAMAYGFVGLITMAILMSPRALNVVSSSVGIVMAVTVLPMTAFLLIAATGRFELGPLVLWKGRFLGWSTNPNQVSLALAPIPFLLMYKLGAAHTRSRRFAYGGLLACAALAGVASLSDALNLAWVVSIGIIVVLHWGSAVRRPALPYWTAVVVYILVPLTIAIAVVAIGYPMYLSAVDTAESVYGEGNQGSVRVALWKNGLLALTASPLVGNGPGAFAGIFDPFTNGEAHNTFIDWSASTGLLGITVYLLLLGWVAWRAWGSGHSSLVAAVVALTIFSTFHFVLRQPLFWFYMIFVAAESQLARAPRRARESTSATPVVTNV